MGDRGNIVVLDEEGPPLYLYSHWEGRELAKDLATVLSHEARWRDGPYLARMIFCQMIGTDVAGTTGFGISTYVNDNEHHYLVVDITNQRVCITAVGKPKDLRERLKEGDFEAAVPFDEWRSLPELFAAVERGEHE